VRGRLTALAAAVAVLVAGIVIAVVAQGGSDTSKPRQAPATASTPDGVIALFYKDAAGGNFDGACALLASQADPRLTPGTLVEAATHAVVPFTSDCKTTLGTFDSASPGLLAKALPMIRTKVLSISPDRKDVLISRTDGAPTYRATVVRTGPTWKILACAAA
jgi:hypothetical protein